MKRRDFGKTFVGMTAGAAFSPRRISAMNTDGGITDVQGIKVGHFTDTRRPTGCTVLIFENGATAGVDVRGAAPGTRETDLLNPVNTVQKIQAILLTGGSAYGLDAASGVMQYLEEHKLGLPVGANIVPIVPAAVLFDLPVGDGKIRPTADSGYKACQAATSGKVAEGNAGAGAGATVGKMFGMKSAMKSGIGTASIRAGNSGIVVGAIIAVNSVGDVSDPKTGKIIAGARKADGSGFVDTVAEMRAGRLGQAPIGAHTAIGVVATNAAFDKAQMTKIAQMAHDGLARCVNPVHTPNDGDTIFAVAAGTTSARADHGVIGALAAEAISEAIVRAVMAATALPGLPSYGSISGR